MSSPRTTWSHLVVSLRAMLVLTVILGVAYPLLVTGLGRLLPARADGSPVTGADGAVVGSSLLGQSFTDADGAPLPQYFQSRPGGYDPLATGASNLGPEDIVDTATAASQNTSGSDGGATRTAVIAVAGALVALGLWAALVRLRRTTPPRQET